MISPKRGFEFQKEYNKFQRLITTKEYVSKEEYEFIISYDSSEKINFDYIGDYSSYGDYLNLNIYSEHDHEKRQYEMETGVPF